MRLLLFALAFAIGPLIYLWLLRGRISISVLGTTAVIATSVGLYLRFGQSSAYTSNAIITLGALSLFWAGWIAGLAVLGLKLMSPKDRKLIRVGGSLATTVPWFGFAAAQSLAH